MFLDYKKYHLNNLIYIWIMVRALAVCETMEILVIKYQAENPKIQPDENDIQGFLYLAMKNIYLAFIVGFALCFIILLNQKLEITAFCELLCLILTFSLPPFQNFYLSLPNFRKSSPNPYKIINTI